MHISENTIANFKHPFPRRKLNTIDENWKICIRLLFYWLLLETEVAILYSYLFFLQFVLPYINSFLYSKAPIDSHIVIIPLTKLKSTHDSLTRFPVPIYNDKSQLQEFFLNFHLLRMYTYESNIKFIFSFFHSSVQVKYMREDEV